ncbi:MAG: tRNA(Ile)-lysidine synthetase [Verrucomicrobia bacterium]|nr:tRNA(Ile)-lysidine synthetase [Verrucomicrobiota bacterium]
MTRKRAAAPTAVRWPQAAAKLAGTLALPRLHPAVVAWTAAAPRETWFVAFSGGADSLALLLLVWSHWPERRKRLRALHFDHRLRGADSRGDAAFCRRVCRALNIPLIEDQWAEASSSASEADARAARHAFFDRHAGVLWLGHQQDDIAETLLMRIAAGSGAAGLAAPRPVHELPAVKSRRSTRGRTRLRPLLTLQKSEVTAALTEAGAVWREDSTNATGAFFRNRLRRDVLPAWRDAAQRDALAGAARTRELIEEDDVALEAWLAKIGPVAADGSLSLRRLASVPRAVARRALHRWILAQPVPIRISRQGFDGLLDAALRGNPTRQSLGRDLFAVIGSGKMRLKAEAKRAP